MPTASREQLLSVVAQSPVTVAAHDRAGWLGLFIDGGVVEDPVGSRPAINGPPDDQLGRFYDTFIGPNEVAFDIREDLTLGLDVMRDAVIRTKVSGIAIDVPAYLLYQLVEQEGRLRVRRMAAHWELATLSASALRLGPKATWTMTRLFLRMLRLMGAGWVAGYVGAMYRGIGGKGKDALTALAGVLDARDQLGVAALFASYEPCIDWGERRLAPGQLLGVLPPDARIALDAPIAAGWTTSARFRLKSQTAPSHGILHATFGQGGEIAEARFFLA